MFVHNKKENDERPNLIFIITDQQRFDTIAELGYPHLHTPNLDRLVREGITFTQCHVTAASCAAARASLFKGYYPHTTGILKNADTWRRSWIERLNDSGYYCTNIGKMHRALHAAWEKIYRRLDGNAPNLDAFWDKYGAFSTAADLPDLLPTPQQLHTG